MADDERPAGPPDKDPSRPVDEGPVEPDKSPTAAQQPVTVGWRRVPGLRRFRSAGAALAATVGLVTALFGAYVGYRSLPEPVALADWQRQVNSICEQSGAELRDPLRNLGDTIQDVSALVTTGKYRAASADLTTTARDLQDTADSYKAYIGRARALDRPDDRRVDDFLDAGASFYREVDEIANDLIESSRLVAAIPADGSNPQSIQDASASLQTAIDDMAEWQSGTNVAYQESILALDLEQCPGWNDTGKPSPLPTPAPSVTSPVGDLDPSQQALARLVGISPDECAPIGAPIDNPGATAQLNCNVDGLERAPALLGFDSVASLRTWFNLQATNRADCGAGERAEFPLPVDWDERGRIKCTPLDTGAYRIDVMLPDLLVGIGAEAEGPSQLERWMRDFVLSLD